MDAQTAFEHALRQLHPAERTTPSIEDVRTGISLAVYDSVRERMGIGSERLERLLGVSTRTLQRRRHAEDRLTAVESDRLWRLLHVFEQAKRALGSEDAVRQWLLNPHAHLGDEAPLDRLDTQPGLREVEDMLTVIDETGVA
ncbi:MAG: antitoxin Xre-like helix-turn-helix domain-containing protein [Bacteroidota bacterium]